MTKYASALLLAVASLQAVSAGPVNARAAEVHEVIPGPGLPSLESLGLTSAELYAMPLPENTFSIESANFNQVCGPSDDAYTSVQSLIACYNYLNGLGTTNCGIGGGITEFCRSGSGHATGQSIRGSSESSYCRDVAAGLLSTINACTRPQQDCAGFQAAAGNGNLIVGGTAISYD